MGTPTTKRLGLAAGIAFAAGAMVGPGFFVLPGSSYAEAGPALVLSYALAAVLILPAVLSKCELVSAIPRTGGSYVYVERGLGPLAATVTGGVDWLASVLKVAFALEGVGSLAVIFLPWKDEQAVRAVAVVGCLAIYIHFALGARLTSLVLITLVGFVTAAVLVYAGAGMPQLEPARLASFPVRTWETIITEAGLVCVAFGGMTSLVKIAGEFETPAHTVPRAMLWAFGGCAVLYLLGVLVTVGVVDADRLRSSSLPLAVGAEAVFGEAGRRLFEVTALVAFIPAATTGIFSASRTLWAMARDGLAPAFLGGNQARRVGPLAATSLTTTAVATLCALLSIESVIKAASAMLLLQLIIVEVSILVLARSPGFRPTFHIGGQPWLQLGAIVCYGVLLSTLGPGPIVETLVVVAVSGVWYYLYPARRLRRMAGLVRTVQQLTAGEPATSPGDRELRSLAISHTGPQSDPFTAAVAVAPLLDVDQAITCAELFQRLGSALGPRLHQPPERIAALLQERENLASCVVAPGLAIPHTVVEGSGIFQLALVRCAPGIAFGTRPPGLVVQGQQTGPVYAAVTILCSEDTRHLHLQTLMRLARNCARPDFLEQWLSADVDAIGGLILD